MKLIRKKEKKRKELTEPVSGFYKNENSKFIFFLYNLQQNNIMDNVEYNTIEEMLDEAFNLIECEYYMSWCKDVQSKANDKVSELIKFLGDEAFTNYYIKTIIWRGTTYT